MTHMTANSSVQEGMAHDTSALLAAAGKLSTKGTVKLNIYSHVRPLLIGLYS